MRLGWSLVLRLGPVLDLSWTETKKINFNLGQKLKFESRAKKAYPFPIFGKGYGFSVVLSFYVRKKVVFHVEAK